MSATRHVLAPAPARQPHTEEQHHPRLGDAYGRPIPRFPGDWS